MAKVTIKNVDISEIVLVLSENLRDAQGHDYDSLPNLQTSIRDNGYTSEGEQVTLWEKADGLHVIRGFRRTICMKGCPELGFVGLAELYPNGYTNPESGEVHKFDTIPALVGKYTDEEAFKLKNDHGQVEPLSTVGLFNSIFQALSFGWTDRKIVSTQSGLIDATNGYSDKAKAENDGKVAAKMASVKPDSPNYATLLADAKSEVYFNFRKGWFQGIKAVYKSPDVVVEAYKAYLRGDAKWPTIAEVKNALAVYEAEWTEMGGINVSKAKPGPKFMAHWDNVIAQKATDLAENPDGKPRATSAMTGQELRASLANWNSNLAKIVIKIGLREINSESQKIVDALMCKLEEILPDSERRIYDTLLQALATPPAVAA